jgi:beta-glucosidase
MVLLYNAGPLDVSWAVNSERVHVIMECFFPAQSAGEALRRVVYNDGPAANPAGRLPNTWPASVDQVSWSD